MMLHLYRFLYAFMPRVPLALAYRLADIGADLLWLWNKNARARVEQNQRQVLGPKATARQIALNSRAVFRTLTKNYIDEFQTASLTTEVFNRIEFEGLEHLDAALAKGRGLILSSAHYGAPYIAGQSLVLKGYPLTMLAEHLQPEELFQFIVQQRKSLGIRVVPVDAPLLGVIRELKKENRMVGVVADRNVAGTGICLPFFGVPARFPTGAVHLALRTGAPLIVAFGRRRPDNGYRIVIYPPLDLPEKPADMDAEVRDGMTQLLAKYETFIGEAPEQWVLTTPLWDGSCETDTIPREVAPSSALHSPIGEPL